jgi:hypothetical protein
VSIGVGECDFFRVREDNYNTSQVFDCTFLGSNFKQGCFFERRMEKMEESAIFGGLQIPKDVREYAFVRLYPERAKQHKQWNVLFELTRCDVNTLSDCIGSGSEFHQ